MSSEFQALTTQALCTEYASNAIFERCPNLKIATLVRNRSELFANDFRKYAHTYEFQGQAQDTGSRESRKPVTVTVRVKKDVADLEGLLTSDSTIEMPLKGKTFDWLRELHINSRGFELGTYQPSILSNSMKMQSIKWEAVAMGYISDIITMVHNFIVDLLEHVCPEESIRHELMVVLNERLTAQYTSAIESALFLLQIECAESPSTLDEDFTTNLDNRYDHSMSLTICVTDCSAVVASAKSSIQQSTSTKVTS